MFQVFVTHPTCTFTATPRPEVTRDTLEAAIDYALERVAQMKIGDRVSFMHYSTRKTGWIARISPCGAIVYLTDGRWIHAESVMLES